MRKDGDSAPEADGDAITRLLEESRQLIERSRRAQARAEAASTAILGIMHASEGVFREFFRPPPGA